MRRMPVADYTCEAQYRKDMERYSAGVRMQREALAKLISDSKANNSIYIHSRAARRGSLVSRRLARFGYVYLGEIDWEAERLLNRWGSPWLTRVRLSLECETLSADFAWKSSFLSSRPSLEKLTSSLAEFIDRHGVKGFWLTVDVTEADGRTFRSHNVVEECAGLAALPKVLFEEALSDGAKMLGPYSELWEIRRRAIERILARGSPD